MKKLLALFLAFAMVFSSVAALAEIDVNIDLDDATVAGTVYAKNVSTYEELLAALEEDNANIIMLNDITATATENSGYGKAGIVLDAGDTFDGNGYRLKINGANGTWDCAIAIKGGTIKNLTIDGAMRGTFMPGADGDVVIDNCVYDGVIYTFNSDAGSKDYSVTIKNSTINGWTSFSNVHKSVTFENCTFGEKYGYAFCRPYNSTTFTNCDFVAGYEMEPVGTIEVALDDCTYASEPLNEYNAASMFYAGGSVSIDGKATTFEAFPENPAAQIGDIKYATLQAAVNNAAESDTIYVIGAVNEGTLKLPANLKDVTIDGQGIGTLVNTTLSAADGNSYNYENLTIKGLTFDNSRILLTGWRNGEEVIKNLVVTDNVFKNLDDTTNTAPLHINKDASEAVEGLTFTNNVIECAKGGQKSGIYAQATGEVIVENNVINNVSFRPYVIQITTDDGIDDNFVVKGNTFSNSAAGRLQGLGNNDEGTDNVNLVITNNIIHEVTNNYEICYWNFNPAATTSDFSRNYFGADIVNNPSGIYYNGAAASTDDLIDMGIFPFYTALDAEGKIDPASIVDGIALADAAIGDVVYSTAQKAVNAATAGDVIVLLADAEEKIVLGSAASTFSLRAVNAITVDLNEKTAKAGLEVNSGDYEVVNGTIKGDIVVNGGSLELENVTVDGTLTVNGGTVAIVSGTFNFDPTAYVVAGSKAIVDTYGIYKVVGAATNNSKIAVKFVKADVDTAGNDNLEGEDIYNIVVANEVEINKFNSADLTFKFTDAPFTGAEMAYEILEVEGSKISVTKNADYSIVTDTNRIDRYMFNFDTKAGVIDTDDEITIGQLKVTGYGSYDFEIVEHPHVDVTNEVHATTKADSVVDTYDTTGAVGKGVLDISDKLTGKEIVVPTRTLKVQIAFPNELKLDNVVAYQDMKVTIEGNFNGEEKTEVYDLGSDGFAMTNKGYVVEETELVLNNTYNVTVSGAGYRTARYTVTMTEDKTLNFWNNVKDNPTIIEVGKETSTATVTFLAGDIVKDNNINIYDLSAVVSYFGTLNVTTAKSDYAKYDLNRDGKIDSKDVAYVLVSWGK